LHRVGFFTNLNRSTASTLLRFGSFLASRFARLNAIFRLAVAIRDKTFAVGNISDHLREFYVASCEFCTDRVIYITSNRAL
jgi:hypothetical protein